jgi:hypothetical protein
MKKLAISMIGLLTLSLVIYSCTKQDESITTSKSKNVLKTSEVIKPPRSLAEYLLLEQYVQQNMVISHEQFVNFGNTLVFIDNVLAGSKSDPMSFHDILTPNQFFMIYRLVFKGDVHMDYSGENPYCAEVNTIYSSLHPNSDLPSIAAKLDEYPAKPCGAFCYWCDCVSSSMTLIYEIYYN